jgi:hypothetical protein
VAMMDRVDHLRIHLPDGTSPTYYLITLGVSSRPGAAMRLTVVRALVAFQVSFSRSYAISNSLTLAGLQDGQRHKVCAWSFLSVSRTWQFPNC